MQRVGGFIVITHSQFNIIITYMSNVDDVEDIVKVQEEDCGKEEPLGRTVYILCEK